MCLFFHRISASDVLIDVLNLKPIEIRYFNSRIGKYKVRFSDGDEDFVGIEEIDGVEVVLL